jgi:hypothetical protein
MLRIITLISTFQFVDLVNSYAVNAANNSDTDVQNVADMLSTLKTMVGLLAAIQIASLGAIGYWIWALTQAPVVAQVVATNTTVMAPTVNMVKEQPNPYYYEE